MKKLKVYWTVVTKYEGNNEWDPLEGLSTRRSDAVEVVRYRREHWPKDEHRVAKVEVEE